MVEGYWGGLGWMRGALGMEGPWGCRERNNRRSWEGIMREGRWVYQGSGKGFQEMAPGEKRRGQFQRNHNDLTP